MKKRSILKKCIPISIVIIIILLLIVAFKMLTRPASLDNSKYFDRGFVENATVEVVNLVEAEDYNTLYKLTGAPLKKKFSKNYFIRYKTQVCDDWGKSTGNGTIYTSEIIQNRQHYADCTMEATYENVKVQFHLTFNTDMKLVDLTMEEE